MKDIKEAAIALINLIELKGFSCKGEHESGVKYNLSLENMFVFGDLKRALEPSKSEVADELEKYLSMDPSVTKHFTDTTKQAIQYLREESC